MNKPIHPVMSSDGGNPAYEVDAYGWALAQAEFIRSGRFDQIDWMNVAEEIEDVARREKRIAESVLAIVLMHILKWQFQPTHRSKSWSSSIREHLRRFDRQIQDSPSLRPQLDDILAEAYERARFDAAMETGLAMDIFPKDVPSWDVIRASYDR